MEGRVDRLSENNYNGLVLRMHGHDDKKKGPLQFYEIKHETSTITVRKGGQGTRAPNDWFL